MSKFTGLNPREIKRRNHIFTTIVAAGQKGIRLDGIHARISTSYPTNPNLTLSLTQQMVRADNLRISITGMVIFDDTCTPLPGIEVQPCA